MIEISCFIRRALLAAIIVVCAGCAVGPDYSRPQSAAPVAYKEPSEPAAGEVAAAPFQPAEPNDGASRGRWWEIYHDPALSGLEEQVALSNQNIAAAAARFREAQGAVSAARSRFFPQLFLQPSFSRTRTSDNSGSGVPGRILNAFELPVDLSYQLDVWGGIRRTVEASEGAAQASFAQLENARLSYQSLVAQNYFLLRGIDAEKRLLDTTLVSYNKYLDLTRERYKGGIDSQADIAQAETQLNDARVELIDLGVLRTHYEHALAVLVGKAPADLAISEAPDGGLTGEPAQIPAGVPSTLLERRPDIASAERLVAAANARIGVAKAAFFPAVTLGATAGLESVSSGSLFLWPSRFWSFGPAVTQTLYDGGNLNAQLSIAKGQYDEAVANYRETVLEAFQQVEDNLSSLRVLAQESSAENDAVISARKSLEIATDQYKAGVQSYLQVITAQTTALTDQLNAVRIHTSRMTASVILVQALGGGWTAAQIPSESKIVSR